MKRKIFNSLLLLTTFVAAMSVFVSCNDYDDDISDLRNQISTTSTDLQSLVTQKINEVNTQIANLQTQSTTLEAAYKSADDALQATLEASITSSVSGAITTAEGYADVQAAAAQTAAIAAAQTLVDNAVANLQVQLDAAIAEAADGLASLQGYVDASDASLSAQITAAVNAANDADADLQTQINAINTAIEGVQSALETKANSSDLEALKDKVEEYNSALIAADTELEKGIAAAQARADEAYELAQQALNLAQNDADNLAALGAVVEKNNDTLTGEIDIVKAAITANETSIGNLETTVTGLSNTVDALEGRVTTLEGDVADVLNTANTNKANIEALDAELETLQAANEAALVKLTSVEKDLASTQGDVETLTKNYEDLKTLVEANQKDIENALAEEVEALEAEISAAVIEAYAYADVVAEIAADNLASAVKDFEASIEEVKTAYADADKALSEDIESLSTALSEVAGDLQQGIDDLTEALAAHEAEIEEALKAYATTADLEELQTTLEGAISASAATTLETVAATYATLESVEELEEAIESIQKIIGNIGDGEYQSFAERVAALEESVAALQTTVATINKYLGMEMKRLKSLVLAPTSYFNGIECIKFSTLSYTNWGENLYADAAPTGGDVIVVSDDSHTEEYLVNPSNVTLASIASLSFVANTATDLRTRAVSDDAPIAVAASSIEKNEKGVSVLKLNLKKTNTDSFGMNPDEFTIVALKAVIAEDFMTDEEKEAGEEVAVYSDWARLCETSAVPYIHNAQAVDANGSLIEDDDEYLGAHFWAFSDIYGAGGDVTTTVVAPEDIKDFIIEITDDVPYLDYRETIDLSEFSIICDKEGNTYDPEAYGFYFEYNVVPCLVGDASSSVDQSKYASITNSVLTPTGADGTEFSTEAINKTPVIQVVLRDETNDAVVDVRYFVIKIYDKDAQKDYGTLDTDTLEYACGGMALVDGDAPAVLEKSRGYTMTANTLLVQKIWEKYNMTEEKFFETYTELTGMYPSLEEAGKVLDLNGGNAETDPRLGSIEMNDDHSLTWTIYYNDAILMATDADYAKGYMEVSAWAVFASATAENIVTFELTLRLEIGKMEVVANHNQTMWTSETGARVVNPQIETDAVYGNSNYETTMILASLLQGYINNGIVPGEALDLVNKGDNAYFVFDTDRFDELYEETGTDPKIDLWTVDVTGTTLYFNSIPAAQIITDETGDVWIQLFETVNGSATSKPTEAAKLLVGNSVPVKLVDEWCDLTDEFEHFDVNFLTPLAFSETEVEVDLTDIYSGGSTSGASLDNTIRITENAINDHRIVWDNYVPTGTNAELVAWYGVENPIYDVDNAMTNLQLDGKLGNECNVKLSAIQNKDGSLLYRIEYEEEENAFIFYNDSGSAISQAFDIMVPVIINTKWQDATVIEVTIHIKPGHSQTVRQQH